MLIKLYSKMGFLSSGSIASADLAAATVLETAMRNTSVWLGGGVNYFGGRLQSLSNVGLGGERRSAQFYFFRGSSVGLT
jgi:hypothetical protein